MKCIYSILLAIATVLVAVQAQDARILREMRGTAVSKQNLIGQMLFLADEH